MFHLHCWHEDKSTRRKIRVPQRCQSDNPSYLRLGDYGCYIEFKSIDECCICHKKRITSGQADYSAGLKYPDILDEPLVIK